MEENKRGIGKNIKWIVVGILLFCFTMIVIFMVTDRVYVYDNYIYNAISKLISPTMTTIVKVITNLP